MWFSIPINATTIGLVIIFSGIFVISRDKNTGRSFVPSGEGILGAHLMITGISVIAGGIINAVLQ